MKAWRFYALGDMRLDEVPEPEVRPRWVKLQTRVVQPSVTEAVRARGGATSGVEYIKKVIQESAPVQLLGHEFCAEIVEVGEGVTGFEVGDRVSGRPSLPCGRCEQCGAGFPERCRRGPSIGREIQGAFCERFVVPTDLLVKLPDSVSDAEGACMQPLGSAIAEVADADIQVGDTVVVMGQGVMGLYVVQLARIGGAGRVIGVDIKRSNLQLSEELGSDHQVDSGEVDPVEAIRDLTGGLGADIVFECAGGSPAEGLAGFKALEQAIDIAAIDGKVVQVAQITEPFLFNPGRPRGKSLRYLFPRHENARFMEHAVRVVAGGRVKVKPLITHVLYGLEKVPEAFEITSNKGRYGAMNPAQVVV